MSSQFSLSQAPVAGSWAALPRRHEVALWVGSSAETAIRLAAADPRPGAAEQLPYGAALA